MNCQIRTVRANLGRLITLAIRVIHNQKNVFAIISSNLYCLLIGAEVRTQFSIEEEDDLLQFAIQQSLLEAGSERDEVILHIYSGT